MSLRDYLIGVQAILLDVDGTLYRQNRVRVAMMCHLCVHCMLKPRQGWRALRVVRSYRDAQEQVRESNGNNTVLGQMALTARQTGVDMAEVRAIVTRWMEQQPLSVLPRAVFPDMRLFLDVARRQGLRMGVVSDYKAADKIAAMGIEDYFQVVISAQDTGVEYLKPNPRGLQTALDRLGIAPEAALYIGDRAEVDALAARRAGLRCLILGTRHPGPTDSWLPLENYRKLARALAEQS